MNIKILDSWLRDYLKTKASAHDIAKAMSLTSISIERVEAHNDDFIYDIEVTTNRPDLMSVVGLAREAAAVLPQFGHTATFTPPQLLQPVKSPEHLPLTIINDEKLVGRICAVVMEIMVKPSPATITKRLEASGIRSLNNIIDITNYVMRVIGHPTHVFDYDRLPNHTIRIRESKKGESITTLDGKSYLLQGGDIVADDGQGTIIDLLGIMGLENSVVTDQTKRIVFFIDNNDRHKMRKTSMNLGIRTEAAQMNEKGIDPELAHDALLYGIHLYEKEANGKLAGPIVDIHPHPYQEKTVSVTEEKIRQVMGIPMTLKNSADILTKLGFSIKTKGDTLDALVPSVRAQDIEIPEDLIEEIARVYGYHNLPDELPPVTMSEITQYGENAFYWEERAKQALKYWGYTEIYSYPMVSENMYEGPTERAVRLANPLGEDFVYMRRTLVPSLLKVIQENKQYPTMKLFEIANVYEKDGTKLPQEIRMVAGVLKTSSASFFEVKGLIEQLGSDFGIKELNFKSQGTSNLETDILINKEIIGSIEILDDSLINFELDFDRFISHATLHKTYRDLAKYPPVIEDISVIIDQTIPTAEIVQDIKKQSTRITSVSLIDRYQTSRTFHILYQHPDRNLTVEEVSKIRESITTSLEKNFKAKIK